MPRTTTETDKARLELLRKARSYFRSGTKMIEGAEVAENDYLLTYTELLRACARTLDWIDEAIFLIEGGDEDADDGGTSRDDQWPGESTG